MKPTGYIDLHCDTLTDSQYTPIGNLDTLNDPMRALAFSKVPAGTKWAQFFAIFIPDDQRNEDAIRYFEHNVNSFYRQMEKFSELALPCRNFSDIENAFLQKKFAAILTVEGGAVLAGQLERVKVIADAGVKALTLVWNGENELGSGNKTEKGLSEFGKQAVPELEKHNILIDISHLNDNGFEDLLTVAKKPFIASHSNARAIAPHKRNLTDAQIGEIVKRGGLIGLNYYVNFLREDGDVQSMDDLYRHIEHFLSLGAEKCLSLGSDYDGAKVPEFLNSVEKAFTIYDYLLEKGLSSQLADDILFGNAHRFFERNMQG